MIKNSFLVLLLAGFTAFSQESLYKKILFNKELKTNELTLTQEDLNAAFPNFLFDNLNFRKITSFYIETYKDKFVIDSNSGSLLECTFTSDEGFVQQKYKIQNFALKNYNNFNEDFDYKTYTIFVQRGFIIAFNKIEKTMLMIDVNSCIFEKQKSKVLRLLKNKKTFDVFVLNCGGKELVSRS
ncbi:hypothetical protein [Flavobacterium foetidum]|uniref:hypothetical protein n=1 Tax=Flavobacterium foetidum TaxID=2026681 RepID=UPI00107559A2|nr:hypothetical protein [Flavobacterium foetidum]KAF2513873.1 hypothetical protein E0W73_13680 [Flavobacterium foetidum]